MPLSKNSLFSLRFKIISMLFVVTALIGLGALALFQRALVSTEQERLKAFEVYALGLSESIAGQFFERYGDVQAFALNDILLRGEQNEIAYELNRYVDLYDIYDLILFVDNEGHFVAANSRASNGDDLDLEKIRHLDFSQTPWFKAVRSGNFTKDQEKGLDGTFFQDAHIDDIASKLYSRDMYGTSFSSDVKDRNGVSLGVITARAGFRWVEYDFVSLYRQMQRKGLPSTEITLLDKTGTVLIKYAPSQDMHSKDARQNFETPRTKLNLVELGDQAAIELINGRNGNMYSIDPITREEYAIGFASVHSNKFIDAIGWNLLVRASRDDLVTDLKKSRFKFFASMLSLMALVYCVVFVVSTRILDSVAKIAKELKMLADIVQYSNDPIISQTLNGTVVSWNPAAEKIYGYSKKEMVGSSVLISIPSEKHEEEREMIRRMVKGEKIVHYETNRVSKDGKTLDIFLSVSPVFDIDGRVIGVSKIARDITETKRADQHFRALLESAPDAMVITNSSGEIILVNAQTENLFSYHRSKLIGQKIDMLVPKMLQSIHPAYTQKSLDSAKPPAIGIELSGMRADATEFPVEISLSPLSIKGEILVSSAIRDITERRKMEKELQKLNSELEEKVETRTLDLIQKNRELEQYAFVAAHDLQQPVRTIANYIEILRDDYHDKLDDTGNSLINDIIDSTMRMRDLIKDLLNYSRASQAEMSVESVDLEDLIGQIKLSLFESTTKGDEVITHDKLPTIRANKVLMTQLFQNILSNSIKYVSDKEPRIQIVCKPENSSYLRFEVSDNGIGFEKWQAEKIFGLFTRLHPREKYPGTGLGLALCRRVVERHGGKIWAESEPSHGTTIFFTISIKL